MNILHVTAQKPSSTGSGIYLTQLAKGFSRITLKPGCPAVRQAILAGVYREDIPQLEKELSSAEGSDDNSSRIELRPVVFDTAELPFHIFGMSDVMPYPSSRYSQMTDEQFDLFRRAFLSAADQAIKELQPDVIICHHLYLLTALIREHCPDIPVYGFSHNTDLTQYRTHSLAHNIISHAIPRLDGIFALHEAQARMIEDLFAVPSQLIHLAGGGYNPDIFCPSPVLTRERDRPIRIVYAGKLSRAKGVPSLLRALMQLSVRLSQDSLREVSVTLAGGSGSRKEYDEILGLAQTSGIPVAFAGRLTQSELADLYRRSDIFVLPSMNEGLPLSVIEALACGLSVVMTDLPGIQSWLKSHIADAPVRFVPMQDGLIEEFESDLSDALCESLAEIRDIRSSGGRMSPPDLSCMTWDALAERIYSILN